MRLERRQIDQAEKLAMRLQRRALYSRLRCVAQNLGDTPNREQTKKTDDDYTPESFFINCSYKLSRVKPEGVRRFAFVLCVRAKELSSQTTQSNTITLL